MNGGVADRVLVVDDDPPLRRMLERTLLAEGYDVTLAVDAEVTAIGRTDDQDGRETS